MHTEDLIRSFIVNTGRWHGTPAELTNDYLLIDNEVLDSLAIFELVAFLEDEFGIVVEDDDLVVENFESITAIGSLIVEKVVT